MVRQDGRVDTATELKENCPKSVTMIDMKPTSGVIPRTWDAFSVPQMRVWVMTKGTVAGMMDNSTAVPSGKMEDAWQVW